MLTRRRFCGERVQTRPVAGVLSREVSRALSTCIALAGVALSAHQRLADLSPLRSSRSSKNRTKQKILMLIQQRPTVTQCQLVNYPFQCILKFIDVLCFLLLCIFYRVWLTNSVSRSAIFTDFAMFAWFSFSWFFCMQFFLYIQRVLPPECPGSSLRAIGSISTSTCGHFRCSAQGQPLPVPGCADGRRLQVICVNIRRGVTLSRECG